MQLLTVDDPNNAADKHVMAITAAALAKLLNCRPLIC